MSQLLYHGTSVGLLPGWSQLIIGRPKPPRSQEITGCHSSRCSYIPSYNDLQWHLLINGAQMAVKAQILFWEPYLRGWSRQIGLVCYSATQRQLHFYLIIWLLRTSSQQLISFLQGITTQFLLRDGHTTLFVPFTSVPFIGMLTWRSFTFRCFPLFKNTNFKAADLQRCREVE